MWKDAQFFLHVSARLVPYLVNNISLMYKRTFNMRHKVVSLTQYNNKKVFFSSCWTKRMLALVGVSLRVIEYMCFHIFSMIRKLVVGFTIPTPLAIHVYSEIVLASTSKVAEWKKLLGREICQEKIYFCFARNTILLFCLNFIHNITWF